VTILREDHAREELRRQLIEEAVEYRRRLPVPPQREVFEEIRRLRESLPHDLELPDSTNLLREDRQR